MAIDELPVQRHPVFVVGTRFGSLFFVHRLPPLRPSMKNLLERGPFRSWGTQPAVQVMRKKRADGLARRRQLFRLYRKGRKPSCATGDPSTRQGLCSWTRRTASTGSAREECLGP
jgi:hypothetical protein